MSTTPSVNRSVPSEVHGADRQAWRRWLEAHHTQAHSVWLVLAKKSGGITSVSRDDAVDEALCFGWIDSVINARDASTYRLRFSPRKPGSGWSRVNKQRIAQLTQQGVMHPAGLARIEAAKRDGSWAKLDAVETLTLPPDLKKALAGNKAAKANFAVFPRSAARAILEWIGNAKQPETRARRIDETVKLAAQNIRANQPRQPAAAGRAANAAPAAKAANAASAASVANAASATSTANAAPTTSTTTALVRTRRRVKAGRP